MKSMIPQSLNRRDVLKYGTSSLLTIAAAGLQPTGSFAQEDAEWRNRQPGMTYRRLGKTGLMVSEVGSGGDPVNPNNYRQVSMAIEMGLNYLDMAPAYGRGECEKAYGMVLGGSSSMRDRVFLATKVSGFTGVRNRMYKAIFDGLPSGKQEAILKRAKELRETRGVEKPGYYITYFTNQRRQFDSTYLSIAMAPDYRHRVEGSPEFRQYVYESVNGSLSRVGTDHFDILHCPHGACAPEEVQIPEIYEAFAELKRQGKVRFLGVTSHNDPAGVLRAAADTGQYDLAMVAYNVINGGYVEEAIRHATAGGMGVVCMKVAMAVATHHKELQPVPDWRIQKLNRILPGDEKPPVRAYLWALQNPNVSLVVSNLWDEQYVRENLGVAGRKVALKAG